MFSIINHQGDVTQNHNAIPLHTPQDIYNKNKKWKTSVGEDVEKWQHLDIAGGNVKWYTLENSLAVLQKMKHNIAI